eukprot:PLAT603.1.p1 GENE.PLAT603.1~~PLAT603.1.p1  ORF type:complete len:476 (-),score=142.41 PLAT603.1:138-1565(-)
MHEAADNDVISFLADLSGRDLRQHWKEAEMVDAGYLLIGIVRVGGALALGGMMYKLRSRFPLNKRELWIMCLILASSVITSPIVFSVAADTVMPCFFVAFQYRLRFALRVFFTVILVVRADLRKRIQDSVVTAARNGASTGAASGLSTSQLVRRLRWWTVSSVIICFGSMIISYIYDLLTIPPLQPGCPPIAVGPGEDRNPTVLVTVAVGLWSIVAILTRIRSLGNSDELGLRRQYFAAWLMMLSITLGRFAAVAAGNEAAVGMLEELAEVALMVALVGDPVYNAWLNDKQGRRNCLSCRARKSSSRYAATDGASLSLKDALADERIAQAFRQHLMREFSVENLMFWLRCSWFAEHAFSTEDAMLTTAQELLKLHVLPGSDLQVNLPHSMVRKVKVAVESGRVSSATFAECADEVYRLLERDAFARFLKTLEDEEVVEKSSGCCSWLRKDSTVAIGDEMRVADMGAFGLEGSRLA